MIRTVSAILLFAIATPTLAADPVKPAPDPNKVRCKYQPVTGSLAATIKTCHTEAEWRQLAEQARNQSIDMQSSLNSGAGGH